jgi:hypothetical protein
MPLPRDVKLRPEHYVIVRADVEVQLSPMQYRMFEMIAGSPIGMTPEALFDRLYQGMDPPMQGRRSVHIQRIHANQKLTVVRMRITSNRRHGGAGSVYKVVEVAA